MHATKDDPAVRSPETRAAISGSLQAHLSARKSHLAGCRCTLCSFAGCSPVRRCGHCRSLDAVYVPKPEAIDRSATSLDAIADLYPQVAALRSAAKLMCAVLLGFTHEDLVKRIHEIHGPTFDVATEALWSALQLETK